MKNAIRIYLIGFLFVIYAHGQTSELTYQGRLVTAGSAANTPHDFEFRLCAAVDDCTTPLDVKQRPAVAVSNGVFTVKLDFNQEQFNGADRWLEIAVRPAGGSTFTPLLPRQRVTSAPYSIKSWNAAQLGGVGASQFVITTDPRMSDPRPPTPGSDNYIQSNPSSQQMSSFDINGNGTVGGSMKASEFRIGPDRVLGVSGPIAPTNTFVGVDAGRFTPTTAQFNTFVGNGAGRATTGQNNSFFGSGAGNINQTGNDNSFFGRNSGFPNTANGNSFFGSFSGRANTSGGPNSFFGYEAGQTNTIGSNNTATGARADFASNNLSNATAIGANALVSQSNSLVLGSINGINSATADTKVGIGTTAPIERLDVNGNTRFSGNLTQSGATTLLTLTNGFVASGTLDSGSIPASGGGARMMFYPRKAAFRAGYVGGTEWDDGNIGRYSTATGFITIASGSASFATGFRAIASGEHSTAMGNDTTASGLGSTAMGSVTTASGNHSTAMGFFASTNGHAGSFVYGDDSTALNINATAANQWTIRAVGGYRFFTSSNLSTGVTLSAGGGSWTSVSDRNAKDNINPVDPREILTGVLRLPISTWNYKGQPQFRHIGAMAQDFHSIFRVGESDKTITTVDPDGVALAAIQGLNEKLNEELKERDRKIERQQQQIDALKTLVCISNLAAEICKPEK